MPTITPNPESLIGSAAVISPRPDIPPRNYGNSAAAASMNPLYNQYNRYPYASQRFPYSGGYSMYGGYGSSYPYYPGGAYGGFNTYNTSLTNNESRYKIEIGLITTRIKYSQSILNKNPY